MRSLYLRLVRWWTHPHEVRSRLDRLEHKQRVDACALGDVRARVDYLEKRGRDLSVVMDRHTDRLAEIRKRLDTIQGSDK